MTDLRPRTSQRAHRRHDEEHADDSEVEELDPSWFRVGVANAPDWSGDIPVWCNTTRVTRRS